MMDLYTFDNTEEDAERTYNEVKDAYLDIFRYIIVNREE